MWDFYFRNIFLVHLLEVGAAIAGSYYLFNRTHVPPETRLMVYYLWLVVFVDFLGLYSIFEYFSGYKNLPFIKDTPWERNIWLFNSYHVIKFGVFFFFFAKQLHSRKIQKTAYLVGSIFIISLILYLVFSGEFFSQFSQLEAVGGTTLLLIIVLFYYYDLLKSNKILYFYKSIPFYISVGLLVWHLTVTPILIYNQYFHTSSPEFIKLHGLILILANVILYGLFIIGFIVCSRNKEDQIKATNI